MVDETKFKISKIDAARTQLGTAIELWFQDKDPASIHTLAAASYQIVHDIKVKRGIGRGLLYDSRMVRDEYRRDWIAAMKKHQNFFKHADRDPDPEGTIELASFGNLVFTMMAATGLRWLGVTDSYHVGALTLWLTLHESQFITPDYMEQFIKGAQRIGIDELEDVREIPKAEFFSHYVSTSLANAQRLRNAR
jgi:hypothetical protein